MGNSSGKSLAGVSTALNRIFEALACKRRRYLLYYLMEHEHATLGALVRVIVERDLDRSLDATTDETKESIRTELYHQHLPKLAGRGLVEYDRRSETVRYRGPPEQFGGLLERVREIEVK